MPRSGALLVTGCILVVWSGEPGGVIASGPGAPVATHGTFEALTYNVAGLPSPVSASRPAEFAPFIGERLNGYDLVLLQEDFCHHAPLTRPAEHPFRSRPQRVLGALVADGLNRLSRFSFDRLRRIEWEAASGLLGGYCDQWAAKGFSVATHELAPGTPVDVYNLHADAGHGSGDLGARRTSFAQLADFIVEHSAGRAVIVGGDFNLCWSSAEDRAAFEELLCRTGLLDVANHVGRPDSHVDRFLFRSGPSVALEPISLEEASEFVTDGGAPLSDHPALRVRFSWRVRI